MRVRNMESPQTGTPVANQFIIYDDYGNTFFQSYDSVIIKITKSGKTFLDYQYWDYSVTTGKYRNNFLGESKKETQSKLDDGTYKLKNLNK